MLSHGARYSGLHLGRSCTLQPHGAEFWAKTKEQSEDRANW